MKKAKSENVADKKMTGATREGKKSVNDPSVKIRSKESEAAVFSFKKTLYGYDPVEVEFYIKELTENNEASARNYELKLSAIKEELALSNRERDSYGEKYRECKLLLNKSSEKSTPEVQNNKKTDGGYEKIIDTLKERLLAVEEENEKLRAAQVDNGISETDEYEERLLALENENREIKARAECKAEELISVKQKYDEMFGEYNILLSRYERTKAEAEAKEKEITVLKEELTIKVEEINSFVISEGEMRKKQAELESENGVLGQQTEENKREIQRLKEINKTQAYEYAEKISRLEGELSSERLAVRKERKLCDYYVNQAQSTLSELSEQMEQIKKAFTDTQSD